MLLSTGLMMYTWYIIAAYSVNFLILSGLLIESVCQYRKIRNRLLLVFNAK